MIVLKALKTKKIVKNRRTLLSFRALTTAICLCLLLNILTPSQAKADFSGVSFAIGIVAGIAIAELSHHNLDDKKTEEKTEHDSQNKKIAEE